MKYLESSLQIATKMFYIFSIINKQLIRLNIYLNSLKIIPVISYIVVLIFLNIKKIKSQKYAS